METKHTETILTHSGELDMARKLAASPSLPKSLPIYMDSVFSFDDVPYLGEAWEHRSSGYVYSRNGHPNNDAAAGITIGQLRFSRGLEYRDDIIAEFSAALEQV